MRSSNPMLVKLLRPQHQFQFFRLLFKTESPLLRIKIGLEHATRPRERRKDKFFYEQNIFEGASLSSPLSVSSLSSLSRNFSSICQLTWFTILSISIITRMTSAVVSSLDIIAVSIGTALVGIFCTFVNVYKTVYGQSMVIFIKGITHEN